MKPLTFPALILLLLAANAVFAQDLNGTWIGSYSRVPKDMVKPQRVVIELTVYNDSLISGASHFYYTRGRFEHHKINGKINRKDGTVILSEDSIMTAKMGVFVSVREGIYTLKLSRSGDNYSMQGIWKDKKRMLFVLLKVDVKFIKRIEPLPMADSVIVSTTPLPATTDSLATKTSTLPQVNQATASPSKTLSPVSTRLADIQKIFEVDPDESDSIKVEVFDNGELDGDTVSIYLDNRVIAQRLGISEKPFTFYFNLDRNQPLQKLKMVAENMGSIPPNTALFTITIGKKKQNVHLSSDMNKNATVEFFLK